MKLKTLLATSIWLIIANNVCATNNQIHRLVIGTGSKMGEVMERKGMYSQKLITPTDNDITIDNDPEVAPTIVGNMGNAKIYERSTLGAEMS